MSTKAKQTSEEPAVSLTSEAQENVSTSEVGVVTMPLDAYVKLAKVNPGTVASFRVEAGYDPKLLEPKTEDEWKMTFIDQSARVYE